MSSERQAPNFSNNPSPCSGIQFYRVIKKAITVYDTHLNPRLKQYTVCSLCGIFLSDISWLETEIT